MKPPTSQKEVRKFILVIYYYCDMWQTWLHTLAPLTKLTPLKKKFECTEVEQDAFEKFKRIVACANFLTYLDFNETFKITTNASALQLGAIIIQKYKPIAFYRRKLADY